MQMEQVAETEVAMLTAKEVAHRVGVTVRTLHNWRARGQGPLFVLLPTGGVRYPATYLQVWLASRAAA